MTLSVVIPAHNAADTLAATLDSLLAQTRGDWQAIIVDDGSRDTTRQIAQGYIARDKRFSLLANDGAPEGVSAARNRGIAAATGRWLMFVDADDTIAATFVDRMVGWLEATPGARVAYCGSIRITASGRRRPPWFSTAVARAPFETLARSFPLVVHGVVLDRALVVEQGGFDARLRTAEDMDFFQRIARTGTAFLAVPEPLALYHIAAVRCRPMPAPCWRTAPASSNARSPSIRASSIRPSVTPPAPIQKRDRRKWRRARTRCGAPRSMSARAATARAC